MVFLTVRVHPFPFRTRKLSSPVPTILVWRRTGKIGQCQHRRPQSFDCGLLLYLHRFPRRCDTVASCSFLTAFLFVFRVCAASRCSMMCSAAALSGCEKSLSASRLLIRSAVCCVSFTSISPSRVIFCVILSRGFNCLIVLHLQSAPSQGSNTLHLIQSRYNGGQGFLLQILWFRFRKTGL
mgnify:CR=1 FL=1